MLHPANTISRTFLKYSRSWGMVWMQCISTTSSELLGINTHVELAEPDATSARKRRTLMLDGVTLEQPIPSRSTWTSKSAGHQGHEPFVRLLGATKIGPDCRIGAGSILRACLWGQITVLPASSAIRSRIAP